jgi:small-conductance mechanosensitive channel
MPDTKTHYWREAGLAAQIDEGETRRARREAIVIAPVIAAVLVAYGYRQELFGRDVLIRVIAVVVLVILGWLFARAIGRALKPMLFKRLDPGTAGTVGFLIRLTTIGLAILVALRVAGLNAETLAVGGALTAVIIGLAAQQTIGNIFAGLVLLSARPLRVGERVRLSGGMIAGQIEGVVSTLGLLYTTLQDRGDTVMVPNNTLITLAITPLREPDAVDLRARLPAETKPSRVQRLLEDAVEIRTRTPPRIALEEVDDDEVVVRVTATPLAAAEGPELADEILTVLTRASRGAASLVEEDGDRGAPGQPSQSERSPAAGQTSSKGQGVYTDG